MKDKSNKFHNLKAKLLNTYYGNPIKDMKLICVTGTTGRTTVAHFIHEILGTAGHRVAVLSSEQEIKLGTLHKFLSDAWKATATHIIVTASPENLKKDLFHGLPVHMTVVTDLTTPITDQDSKLEINAIINTHPEITILNHDDTSFSDLKDFVGTVSTITYGTNPSSDVQIENSKLYKKGSEANINISDTRFTVASFLTGNATISYMAAATAAGNALHITVDHITDGISNYDLSP